MNRRIRLAFLDSGVNLRHPHITRAITGGTAVAVEGGYSADFGDTLGHGTAICALLQTMAPDADIYGVKIFDHQLRTGISVVSRAIEWCLQQQVDIINLSLGTGNFEHQPIFERAIEAARSQHCAIVSAYASGSTTMLPGCLADVVGVTEDAGCAREQVRFAPSRNWFRACPFPLDIEGVPRERNLRGVSFSVAHVSAFLARLLSQHPAGANSLMLLKQNAQLEWDEVAVDQTVA